MTIKERIESALHTAISESRTAVRELVAATRRHDDEAVAYWEKAANYWLDRIGHYTQQLKEVDAN